MTRHLFRLIWNRKRQNFLLSLEIFFAFLVLFAVVLFGMQFWANSRAPLGFDIDRVWHVAINRSERDDEPAVKERHRETMRQVEAALRDLPQVESASAIWSPPYSNASWESTVGLEGGRSVFWAANRADDDLQRTLGLALIAGRWFTREDEGVSWEPVVLNEQLAIEIFGDTNVAGRRIPETTHPGPGPEPADARREKRVVGVMQDFRQHGEYSTRVGYVFQRASLDAESSRLQLPRGYVIKVRPGTTAAFEEALVRRLEATARDWTFTVSDLREMRETKLAQYTVPLSAVGTVAGFLLLMVALGLTGVVWQNVTQRTREFGLRRAKGATATNVRHQVQIELLLMTTLALAAGVLLVAQLPLLPLPPDFQVISRGVFVSSIVVSAAAIYLVTMLCGLYPSRLATKVAPAEALHYE